MKKYISCGCLTLIAIILCGVFPTGVSAAVVYLQSSRSTISVGDTVIVQVKINAEGQTINTVESDVALKSGGSDVQVKEFSLANSIFGLWPRTPSLSQDKTDVSFVGGVPGGFNIEGATMFNIILQANKVGTVTISPKNTIAFANDGKGTKLPVKTQDLVIKIVAKKPGATSMNDWNSLVAQDTIPPNDFIIVPGQDPSMFGGNKFVFFSAVDNQSGISYYDVSENGHPAVRSGSTYVLQNQTGDTSLTVTAYDKADNKKTEAYVSKNEIKNTTHWFSIIVTLCVLGVLWMVYKKRKNNKKNLAHAS